MGGWIEVTDKQNDVDDLRRTNNGDPLCGDVTGWGVLAGPTKSKNDWYHDGEQNNPDTHQTTVKNVAHIFCKKTDSTGSPNVLMVKLFPDPKYNPLGFPVIALAEMTSLEHFAEWSVEAYFGQFQDSFVILHRVPDPDIWFQSMPPIAPLLTPWRVIYNIWKYGWEP